MNNPTNSNSQVNILNRLNDQQIKTVTSKDKHILVLAGAGSGKTTVLTGKIAYEILNKNIMPHNFLAVTFTNKAANEMSERIKSNVGLNTNMWIGSFHGICNRILRMHCQATNLDRNFQIIDSSDQLNLIKNILKASNMDSEKDVCRNYQYQINNFKENAKRSKDIMDDYQYFDVIKNVYAEYEKVCRANHLVDFSELILRTLELLMHNKDIKEYYLNQFKLVLIDEFQDTNEIQYNLVAQLCGMDNQVIAVGDDDQSIYSWRGADYKNMKRFETDFPNTQVIKLEQNYRSTQNILNAANALIKFNSQRFDKNLWTDCNDGENIKIFPAYSEREEAEFVTQTIQEGLLGNQVEPAQVAILFRSNAQSRVIEESLRQYNIPYRIFGGKSFFERAEIKNTLAYLHLIINLRNDVAFERIINFPTRGVGNKTLENIKQIAIEKSICYFEAAQDYVAINKSTNKVAEFIDIIKSFQPDEEYDSSLSEYIKMVCEESGLMKHYNEDKEDKFKNRVENINEFINLASSYDDIKLADALNELLTNCSLNINQNEKNENDENAINLITLHSAKGLEFDWVFLVGLEEGLFPHRLSLNEIGGLEEERRLCYVGITRAKKQLFVSYAETRNLFGNRSFAKASRFLNELPPECCEFLRNTNLNSSNQSESFDESENDFELSKPKTDSKHSNIGIGRRVFHQKFGEGIILQYEKYNDDTKLQIKFKNNQIKWLMEYYANLTYIDN